jgi:hypothetical protein
MVILGAGAPIAVEAETRLTDTQAFERRVALKARDGGIDRLIVLLARSRTNRHALESAGPLLADYCAIAPRTALAALKAGKDPGGGSIILL